MLGELPAGGQVRLFVAAPRRAILDGHQAEAGEPQGKNEDGYGDETAEMDALAPPEAPSTAGEEWREEEDRFDEDERLPDEGDKPTADRGSSPSATGVSRAPPEEA